MCVASTFQAIVEVCHPDCLGDKVKAFGVGYYGSGSTVGALSVDAFAWREDHWAHAYCPVTRGSTECYYKWEEEYPGEPPVQIETTYCGNCLVWFPSPKVNPPGSTDSLATSYADAGGNSPLGQGKTSMRVGANVSATPDKPNPGGAYEYDWLQSSVQIVNTWSGFMAVDAHNSAYAAGYAEARYVNVEYSKVWEQ